MDYDFLGIKYITSGASYSYMDTTKCAQFEFRISKYALHKK